jgi:hypothetical protein
MSDDSAARRDAWRDAQNATTVTGERAFPGTTHHPENIHEDLPPDPEHETARVTHPSNAAPGHSALTNVGTVYDSDADETDGAVTNVTEAA